MPPKNPRGKRAQQRRELTPREELFVELWLGKNRFNGAQSYIDAGYKANNRHTAANKASELLTRPAIKAAIKKRNKQALARVNIKPEKVLQELAAVAFTDIGKFLEWNKDGTITLKPSKDLGRYDRKAISEVRESTSPLGEVTFRFKLHDKMSALGLLMKYLQLSPDKVILTATEELRQIFQAIDGESRGLPKDRSTG